MLCQCPKLTPLQSRFLASLAALAVLGLIYWSLSDPRFAYAAELEFDGSGRSRGGEDHNWHRIAESALEQDGIVVERDEADEEETRVLTARAPAVSTTGGNNVPNIDNIKAGQTTVWKFPKSQLQSRHADAGPGLPGNGKNVVDDDSQHAELRKRDGADGEDVERLQSRQKGGTRTVYISINTCLQPRYAGSGAQLAPPPQLTLYVATDASNTKPGPNASPNSQRVLPLDEGFASTSISLSGALYMAVHAPSLTKSFKGVWNYELAASIDDYFHHVDLKGPNLFLVDSDSTAALLVTNNLTQADSGSKSFKKWMDLTPPYVVFASNTNSTGMMGISNSFCGWNKNAQIMGNQDETSGDSTNVQMEMITRGLGNKPKEQFYVSSLNSSSKYHAVLAQVGNSTQSGSGVVGGGGKVWKSTTFNTKADGNCALLYNLDFCDEVAYAVPSTPEFVSNYSRFQHFYDHYAHTYYHNFNYSLQQIPCRTTAAAQYSLARNCSDCANAYKEWLCAVSIPRCEDFSNEAHYLQIRNVGQKFTNGTTLPNHFLNTHYIPMHDAPTIEGTVAYSQTYISSFATNSSRNPKIDKVIAPGPYKEVLPCEDLCYSLVQSCPAALGFGCPFPGRGLEASYGTRHGNGNGTLTCSYLGAYVYTGGVGTLAAVVGRAFLVAVAAGLVLAV